MGIAGNKISAAKFTAIEARCDLTGITWKDNEIASQTMGIASTAGIESKAPKIEALPSLARSAVGPLWWK